VPRLWRQRPKAPALTYDRGLTARPVVLAKNVRNRIVFFPSKGRRSGPTFFLFWVSTESGDSGSFGSTATLERNGRFHSIAAVFFRPVERLVSRLQDAFEI
jgi:hypothetical protein